MERAFRETYGIELKDVFKTLDLSIGTFRRSVSTIIPEMTKAALLTKNNVDVPEKNDKAKRQYVYYLSRADYEKEWGKEYERPGFFARVLAFLFKLVPKVGPFKAVAFKTPSTQTEDLYLKSLDKTITKYKEELADLGQQPQVHLADINFDTGEPTQAGKFIWPTSILIPANQRRQESTSSPMTVTRICWANSKIGTSICSQPACAITLLPIMGISRNLSTPSDTKTISPNCKSDCRS
jgi:hypothetical protein